MTVGPSHPIALAVAHPHGVRGQLKFVLHHPESSFSFRGVVVSLRDRSSGVWRAHAKVTEERSAGAVRIVTLEGSLDRTAAEALAGLEVCVDRSALPEPDDDEVYVHDLPGLAVEGPDGVRLGEVTRVEVYPAATCLVVAHEGGELEIPLGPPYVEWVDLRARVVRVAQLDELGGR